jgi:thermitase
MNLSSLRVFMHRLGKVVFSIGLVSIYLQTAAAGPVGYVAGRILIKTKSDIAESDAQELITGKHGKQVHIFTGIGVRIVEVPAGEWASTLDALKHHPKVEFAEPDRVLAPDALPNDPYLGSQWHLTRIAAPAAWDTTTGNPGVIIAILDTGVDSGHPDLAANIVAGWNTYDNSGNTGDVFGHGTQVAGSAAAVGNNGGGVASVAYNCRIMPVRISDLQGYAYDSTAANGLTWAADHGARVANLSYQFSGSSTVTAAAKYFQSKQGLVTVSAGNDGTTLSTPENPYMLTVGATDSSDSLAWFSNTGNVLDFVAPGLNVVTTVAGGSYGYASGTSFSAPITAGVIALVLSVNPALTPTQVQQILQQSADDLGSTGWDPQFGWGRINAQKAVALAVGTTTTFSAPPPPTVSITSPANGATVSGTVTVQVNASAVAGIKSVSLSVDGAPIGSSATAPSSFKWITTGTQNGTHTLTATVQDSAGMTAQSSISVNVSNLTDTTPPTVNIVSPQNGEIITRNTTTVSVAANDKSGIVSVSFYQDGKLVDTDYVAPYTFSWNSKKAAGGNHVLQAVARDSAGNVGYSPSITVYCK